MALPQFLLNLLFPPRCPFCDRPVEAVVSAPCPHCLGSDVWLEGAQAVVTGEAFARCVCAGWYREPLRASLRRFKFSGRRDYAKAYGPVLAQAVRTYLPGTYDLITWVPVSPKTLRRRGYDQAQLLAQETARALAAQAVPLLEKTRDTPPQSSLTQGQRGRGLHSAPPGPGGRAAGSPPGRHPHHRRHPE